MRPIRIAVGFAYNRERDSRGNLEPMERRVVALSYPDGSCVWTWRDVLARWQFGDMTDVEIAEALK